MYPMILKTSASSKHGRNPERLNNQARTLKVKFHVISGPFIAPSFTRTAKHRCHTSRFGRVQIHRKQSIGSNAGEWVDSKSDERKAQG